MRSVLIIDGSLTVRMDLKESFEAAGYATTLCATAEAARQQFARGGFALVVLDLVLPDGDGIELLQQLRSQPATAAVPVLLLSTEARDRLRGLPAAADEYIDKPYDRADVIRRSNHLLRRAESAPPDPGEPRRILAVDDSPTYLQALAEHLRLDGHDVLLARSGEEALRLLDSQPVDGILLDLIMPGLSGQETCQRIRASEAGRTIPVLMLTAREDRQAMVESFNAGADDYIAKSAEFEVLRARLRAQLRRKQFEDDNRRIGEQLHQKEVEAVEAHAHREAEAAAHALAQQWQNTFDAIRDGVCLTDATLRIQRANQAFAQIVARPLADVVGRTLQEVLPPELETIPRSILPDLLQTRTRQTADLPAGNRWYRFTADPVSSTDSAPAGGVLILSDITEQKQAAEALREANEAKDHFLATLSHELRTPLTPVLAAASILESDPRLPADLSEDVSMIRRNVELEARLIDDLLDLTRIARGKIELKPQPVMACTIVQHAVETCSPDVQAKGLHLTVDLNGGGHWVHADPPRLQQVLWNLLNNAIKFTPQGGTIAVSTLKEGADVVLEVRDNGVGIETHVLPRIFDAFEQGGRRITRQFGGLGLGLAISRKLVELHNGSIEAHSDGLGRGSRFRVRLPAVPVPDPIAAEELPATPAEARSPDRPLRLLLVEDHVDTSRLLSQLMRRQGWHVVTADSLQAARQAADAETFDLLISDLGLPDGSGMELMRLLHSEQGALKGIALSGYGMEDDIRRSKEAGFLEHLVKPVNVKQLLALIRHLTDPPRRRPEPC